jgi:tetratricopeptide (TPR) repeat protein
MAKLARLPRVKRAAEVDSAETGDVPRLRTRYYAFLSYSHKDRELADWLHRELERFRVPSALAGKLTANGVVPRRLTPIFRDQHDLSAGSDLAVEIEAALAASQFLVVLCSPTAAKSRWTNLEIESFKRTRPEGCVLAAVVAGEPFASDIPGREAEECFPPALRYKYDRRGRQTSKRAEPLAADFRESGEGKRLAFLKLVAGMLGVGLDELVQRETTRRHRQLAYVAAASLGGMAITSTLAVTAIQARDAAREQRRQAEGLVAFMVGDLKDKLEPIGRLDALDGVGARVLAYYSKQDTSELSDAALMQRSKALSLMAEVANLRGDINGSLRLYQEAMVGTAEAVRRNPDDPERLWEHAQNVFYVGQIAQQRQDLRTFESRMREYKDLATRMVALGPDNMKWRMEEQYADFNLGVALNSERRFQEATRQFEEASRTIDAISTADPANRDYRLQFAESLAWLSDSLDSEGQFNEAIAPRQRDIGMLDQLFANTHDNDYRQRLIHANRRLGVLYAEQGQVDLAIAQFRKAVELADQLVPIEPANTRWLEYSFLAHLDLGEYLLLTGAKADAASQISTGCAQVSSLVRHHPPLLPRWRWGSARCAVLQGRIALAAGDKARARQFAEQVIAAAKAIHSGDSGSDAILLAAAYRRAGDIAHLAGDNDGANAAWSNAFAVYPGRISQQPWEMAEHAMILQRTGHSAEGQAIAQKLSAMGYRDPEFRTI